MIPGPTVFLACNAEHFDVATGQCAQPYYALPPSFVPYLSFEDGFLISTAIVLCWAAAVGFRALARVADKV